MKRNSVYLLVVLLGLFTAVRTHADDSRSLLSWTTFGEDWELQTQPEGDGAQLWSKPIHAPYEFDQLIVSWNIKDQSGQAYTIAVRVRHALGWSRFYELGQWSFGEWEPSRTSINHQRDEFGRVSTDTLVLKESVREFQIRIQCDAPSGWEESLAFVGVSLLNAKEPSLEDRPDQAAWGIELAVPQRCQLDYLSGEVWCSPTSISMLLAHWANVLQRSDLLIPVPDLAAQVYDPGWGGTGNWPFNTAYAGSFPGIRAYVQRLGGISDLEKFISAGVPVAVSVAYSVLKGEPKRASDGHLIVCIGFTATGDIIVNDPARKPEVRWVYPRSDFFRAWSKSHNTAYLVHPEAISSPLTLVP